MDIRDHFLDVSKRVTKAIEEKSEIQKRDLERFRGEIAAARAFGAEVIAFLNALTNMLPPNHVYRHDTRRFVSRTSEHDEKKANHVILKGGHVKMSIMYFSQRDRQEFLRKAQVHCPDRLEYSDQEYIRVQERGVIRSAGWGLGFSIIFLPSRILLRPSILSEDTIVFDNGADALEAIKNWIVDKAPDSFMSFRPPRSGDPGFSLR
jgi:hypothetical protein